MRGGGESKDDMMTRGRKGGDVWIPPKNDDVIYEQPQYRVREDIPEKNTLSFGLCPNSSGDLDTWGGEAS